jgi:hypothetical protein
MLRSGYEVPDFLTVLCARDILRESETCGSGPERGSNAGPNDWHVKAAPVRTKLHPF